MQVITVSSITLFDVALRYMGDATQWSQIASQNGLTDPWLNGLVTLTIPDNAAAVGRGIAQQ
jgi:L-ascorbate metabolism protein UlaG (beta-lactamase superfamily)